MPYLWYEIRLENCLNKIAWGICHEASDANAHKTPHIHFKTIVRRSQFKSGIEDLYKFFPSNRWSLPRDKTTATIWLPRAPKPTSFTRWGSFCGNPGNRRKARGKSQRWKPYCHKTGLIWRTSLHFTETENGVPTPDMPLLS